MGVTSCGLLLYRMNSGNTDGVELLIAHMGGPYWEHKRENAWTIPKGLVEPGEEDLVAVAEREFTEEMGSAPAAGITHDLGFSMSGKKRVVIFGREGSFDLAAFVSNEFTIEWPKGSGHMQSFAEVDQADWVAPEHARKLLVKSQTVFVDRLLGAIAC